MQTQVIEVGEQGTSYLRIELDHADKSVSIREGADWGWFWLNGADDCQTIDDVIEALELAKHHLIAGREVAA